MESEPENAIREYSRHVVNINRRFHRNEECDVRRCIDNASSTHANIIAVAKKLKTKALVSAQELQTLKNGLLDEPKGVEVVLNTHGALRGLVRELTGHDAKRQCAAAGCLCNLALGDARAALAVAKGAGAYLVAALGGLSAELAVPCARALGNVAGVTRRGAELVTSQGAVSALCDALARRHELVSPAAAYALLQLSYALEDELRTEHLTKILGALSELDFTVLSSHILFALSCHKDFGFSLLSPKLFQKLLENLPVSMEKHLTACKHTKLCCELVYLLRTLANLEASETTYRTILKCFSDSNLCGGFRVVFQCDSDVKDASLWLLGNLYKCCGDDGFFNELLK